MKHVNSRQDFEDENCHLCLCFTPTWARCLATRKVFTLCYGFQSIIQGMSFMYIVATLTTIESHFQLPSESFGLVMSLGELCCILAGIAAGLIVGAKTNRPRAMGISLLILGIGNNLFALPHYIYGGPIPLDNTINGTSTYSLCTQNTTKVADEDCVTSLLAPPGSTTWGVSLLFLFSYSIANVGGTALYIIGTPFLDDNVQNKNSPMYLAFMCSIRTIGPILGFVLSSGCLAIYVNPSGSPWFDNHDSRWVGAWWLGFVVIGVLSIICGFLMAQFPPRLPSKKVTPAMQMAIEEMKPMNEQEKTEVYVDSGRTIPPLKEMIPSIRRILVNGMLWMRTLSETFTWFGLEGFILYLPKYLEHEFHITASEASLWTGSASLVPTVFGNLLVGYLVKRFQPSTSFLAGALCFVKTIQALIMTLLITLRCDNTSILGSGDSHLTCGNSICDCSEAIFSPICGADGETYFSACHAGCTTSSIVDEHTFFSNCSCILDGGTAIINLCPIECPQKMAYLLLVAASKFCLSVDIIAGTLFLLRCVEPRDKTIASGFLCAFLGLFTFIPCPVVFSALVDGTCDIWSEQCGRTGACNVYNMQHLSMVLHIIPGILLFISVFWDIWFWWLSRNKMELFQDNENIKTDVIFNNKKCITNNK